MSQNETLQVTDEFIQQNLEYSQLKKSHKKGGPYSKNDRDKRRDEVYRLHFDYGYSARNIADLMKVSRHTINGDIDYWYSIILKNVDVFNPVDNVIIGIEQWEVQLTRLREQLDKTSNNSERMSIERLIYDINSRRIHTYQKLAESESRTNKIAVESMNEYMEKNKKPERFLTLFDIETVSQEAQEKIQKIIKEDKLHRNLKKKF